MRANGLQEGDFIVIYSDVKCGKYVSFDSFLFGFVTSFHFSSCTFKMSVMVRAHLGWRGERNISYKGVGTSL